MRVILFWNFAVLGTWFYSSYQTGGLIDNRYEIRMPWDVKIQSTHWSRRYCSNRMDYVLDHPFVGVGVGGQRKNG
jgi:hypothetical protein